MCKEFNFFIVKIFLLKNILVDSQGSVPFHAHLDGVVVVVLRDVELILEPVPTLVVVSLNHHRVDGVLPDHEIAEVSHRQVVVAGIPAIELKRCIRLVVSGFVQT